MDHSGQIFCATMERKAFMLRVMKGCHYNRCRFCGMFKKLHCEPIPLSDIEEELQRVVAAGGSPKQVFLMDGDALSLPADYLLKILALIRKYFPECEAVNTEATVTDVLEKTDEELKQLYDAGIRHVYVGIECVLDDVLHFMNKDHTAEEGRIAAHRLKEAGLYFDVHVLTGIAGEGRGEESALATAQFLNETVPHHILNFSLGFMRSVPLYQDVMTERFKPASEQENLMEQRTFLANLNCFPEEGITYYGINTHTHLRLSGKLPADQNRLLEKLDTFIARANRRDPMYAISREEEKVDHGLYGRDFEEFMAL